MESIDSPSFQTLSEKIIENRFGPYTSVVFKSLSSLSPTTVGTLVKRSTLSKKKVVYVIM